jgi:nucleoside 2-deoxyribosyltransferase
MPTCFVIQPFDKGAYDKRYDDTFVPAITAAGLEAYRVDRDQTVSIPIDDIERNIRSADACLADISEPNPNVWFEVGYAIATGKPIVMVCREQPAARLPFDVQHRTVIWYKTESASDFDALKRAIAARLEAVLQKERQLERLAEPVVASVSGLKNHEMMALGTIAENADSPTGPVSMWTIRADMERQGYRRVAVMVALSGLLTKGLVGQGEDSDHNGNPFTTFAMTARGMDWLISNEDQFILRVENRDDDTSAPPDDDVPF